MILTFKKIQHKRADRTGICFPHSFTLSTIMYLEASLQGRTTVKGACKNRLYLTTEDKCDKKNGGKNNNFGG
jgi:hypothetical protein